MNPRRKAPPQGPSWSDFTMRRSAARKGNAPDPGRDARQYALDRPRGIRSLTEHLLGLGGETLLKLSRCSERVADAKEQRTRLPRHLKRRLPRKYPRSDAHRVRKLKALGVTQADVLEQMRRR